ncbi:MAG: alpha/beta hydrolase [Dehalococcoidia bacterium]
MHERIAITASDGVKLAGDCLGDGPPLYAIHGGPATDRRAFGQYLEPIASYRQLLLLDQRGCGDSDDASPDRYTLARLAEDIEDARVHLRQDKVEILGHSFGCSVAVSYALRYPHSVRTLILVDGAIRGWRGIVAAPGAWWLWAKTVWIGLRNEADSTEFHLAHEVANADKRQEVRELLASPRRYDPARVQRLSMAAARPADLRPLISAGVPVLGIYGKQDKRFVGEAGYLRSVGASVVLIDGAGHFPFVEQHQAFHQTVREFLETRSVGHKRIA